MRAATRDIWSGGLYAGLIGYGTVVIVVAVLNVLAARSPFYTAALFGVGIMANAGQGRASYESA